MRREICFLIQVPEPKSHVPLLPKAFKSSAGLELLFKNVGDDKVLKALVAVSVP